MFPRAAEARRISGFDPGGHSLPGGAEMSYSLGGYIEGVLVCD